jgi:hypothetical protein
MSWDPCLHFFIKSFCLFVFDLKKGYNAEGVGTLPPPPLTIGFFVEHRSCCLSGILNQNIYTIKPP